MPLGLRYPGTSFHHGHLTDTFSQGDGFNNNSTGIVSGAQSFYMGSEASRPYVAPSRYSQVRKVVFWVAWRHEQTGGSLGSSVRLRVAPQSSSSTSRIVESAVISPSTIVRTLGSGSIWSNLTITSESVFYAVQPSGKQNLELARQVSTHLGSGEAQLSFVEFERFTAGAAEFFSDWDDIAADAEDDRYLAYWLALERIDGSPWTNTGSGNVNNRPTIVGAGMAIIQAPANPNNGCTHIVGTSGLYQVGGITTGATTTRAYHFPFRTDDWDNIAAIHVILRQIPMDSGTSRGAFTLRVRHYPGNLAFGGFTDRYTESFNDLASGNINRLARSGDILPSILNGDNLVVGMEAITVNQDLPWAWYEVIQKDFTKTTSWHQTNATPIDSTQFAPSAPPPPIWAKDEALFDPIWFENFPDDLILSERVISGLAHVDAGNDTAENPGINADLGADMTTSPLTQIINPEISSTPNATTGFKWRYSDIDINNPIRLAGQRKFKIQASGTQWLSGSDDRMGGAGLAYGLSVPNSEFLERGPLFDLGAFNPEGCASTAAGLGDPGVLVITNGSVIPKKFNPNAAGTANEIEDNGVPTPFEDEVPSSLVEDTAASPDGGLGLGTYVYRYTFRNCCTGKESDPNPDDIVVDTGAASPAAKVTLGFAGVRIPADPQICEICVYRTVLGGDFPVMAKVGCFDPDTTDVFEDTVSDSALDFVNDGLSLLNAPMPCVPVVVDFRNRLFGLGDIPNLTPVGTVSVVNGSDIVEGSEDVEWDRCLEGKFIKVGSDCRSYEILRVLPPEVGVSPPIGRLRLVDEYEGDTDTGLDYTLCGRPNRIYFSEPLEPECWPLPNFLDVEPGDGDRLMGAVSNFNRLIICKRRKTYVLSFDTNPGLEVFTPARVSSDVGCVGPRTFAQVEVGSVWLAERGVAIYDGRSVQHLPEGAEMNQLFTDPDNPNYVRRDRNGRVIDAVGAFYPAREQYLLLLPTVNTDRGCDLMLVWDVKLRNITLLRFCQQFQSMVVAKDADGNERVYLGDVNGFVWIYDVGHTDGVGFPNATGTVRGTVTAAGIDEDTGASFLDDSAASFLAGGLPELADLSGFAGLTPSFGGADLGMAGACIAIRPPGATLDTPWDIRTVYAATSTRLFITPNWAGDIPQVGSEYMLGAIDFRCVFKPNNYGTDDFLKRDWRQVVVHEIEQFASKLRVELLPDFQDSDPEELSVINETDGVASTGEGRLFRMDFPLGRQVRPVGRLIHNFQAVRFSNFAPEEPIRVINHLLMSTPKSSK